MEALEVPAAVRASVVRLVRGFSRHAKDTAGVGGVPVGPDPWFGGVAAELPRGRVRLGSALALDAVTSLDPLDEGPEPCGRR